jgi:hypothetical protein
MNEGEKYRKDHHRHVDNCIASNQAKWNDWLEAARQTADQMPWVRRHDRAPHNTL